MVKTMTFKSLFSCASKPAVQDEDKAPYATPARSGKDHQMPVNGSTDDCAICMCPPTRPKKLPCGHSFCTDCIQQAFAKCQPKCPTCGYVCGQMIGNQPRGQMTTQILPSSLAGYDQYSTIQIAYDIPNGIQDRTHPNPGVPYHGTRRRAYLPNNDDGQEICRLLKRAFDAKLVFTIGRSITTNHDNAVIWNDIHHKTRTTGQYGYPDATYLQRVRDELAAKGIVSSHQIDAGDGQTQSLAAAADNDVRASQRASARRRQTTRVNPERPKSTNDVTAYTEFSDHNASDRSARKLKRQTSDDIWLKDRIGVEDFLWRYIEKYYRQDLDKMCGSGIKYTYHRSAKLPLLILESTDGSTVQGASESVTSLCQRLAANITETTFACPDGVDRLAFDELCPWLAKNAKAVFYVDEKRVCHVIGPKDKVSSVEREILDQYVVIDQTQTSSSKTIGYRMTTNGGVSVEIYTGNLLQDNVDAVVNPANVYLSHGGGAAKAIADAAGRKLLRECRDYIQRYGHLKFTQVMHTSAGNMYPPVRYVIHAAGPPADQYHSKPAALRQAVFDTFFNCLRYANEQLRISSISIPAISSGIFGVPKDMVAGAAYDALMKFDEQLQLGMRRYLQHINYINLDDQTTAVFIQAFTRSTSNDRSRDREWRAAADTTRGDRRSKSVERQPAKQAFLQSARQDTGDAAGVRRRRTCPDDCMRRAASVAGQPRTDKVSSRTYVGRRRTQHQAWRPDTQPEYQPTPNGASRARQTCV